jgi:hypothetical protein
MQQAWFRQPAGSKHFPGLWFCNKRQKKVDIKFLAVKKLFPLKIFSQIIAMLLYAYLTAVLPIFGK